MAGNPHAMSELHALLAARRSLYEQAELSVDISSLPVEAAVETITEKFSEFLSKGPDAVTAV